MSRRRVAATHRKALAELAAGGLLYVYIGNGPLCRRPVKIGSGVIVGGTVDRLAVTVGTVNAMGAWTQWSEDEMASVIRPELRGHARLIGAGRDVLVVGS